MPMTPLSTPPSRADSTNFPVRGDILMGALPTFVAEANVLEANVVAQAAIATAQAAIAVAAAAAAAAASGAAKWATGTFTDGACVWSPTTYQTYRKTGAGASATDPGVNSAGWTLISSAAAAASTPDFLLQAQGLI